MSDQYEIVIHADDGLYHEHAELLRERLIRYGFHKNVVTVREVADDE